MPSQKAFEAILTESQPFTPSTESTQLIQDEQNVLAKPSILRMFRIQERIADRPGLRVTDTNSAAQIVARQLDQTATSLGAQITTIEQATPTEIDTAVRRAAG